MGKRKGKSVAQLANLVKAREAKQSMRLATQHTTSSPYTIIPVTHITNFISSSTVSKKCRSGTLIPTAHSGRGGFDTVLNYTYTVCRVITSLNTSPSIITNERKRPQFNIHLALTAKVTGVGFDTCKRLFSALGRTSYLRPRS